MAGSFISRDEKSSWGIPCNQKSDGELFVGKGYRAPLADQLSGAVAARIARCLTDTRGDRNGRFWVDLEKEVVTMAYGESSANTYKKAKF